MQKITPFLWFDTQAEDAANYYVSIFRNSKIGTISRYGKEGHEIHKQPEGRAMAVDFELEGQRFTALNGGPLFKFNESVSFQVHCDSQKEVDYYWNALSADGDPKAQQCGWLKDKYGLSWQIVPTILPKLLTDKDTKKSERVMKALMQMKKFDIAELKRVYEQG
jgi:predicted 3-demethylubiquinone-9 3-methyltransferase (glyoxalase superfamily)